MTVDMQIAKLFGQTAGGQRAAGLLRVHKIDPANLLAAVHTEVLGVLPHLIHGVLYSAEDLCGPDLWACLRYDGAKRAAGMCLGYLVECQAVPLQLHWTPSGNGPKRYLLNSAPTSAAPFEGVVIS